MKTIKLVTIILLLSSAGMRAADAAAPTFPEVGSTYFFAYADGKRNDMHIAASIDTILLRIEQALPSGWVYATEIKRTYTTSPADRSKVAFTDEEKGAAWYNLQSFAKAVKFKNTE